MHFLFWFGFFIFVVMLVQYDGILAGTWGCLVGLVKLAACIYAFVVLGFVIAGMIAGAARGSERPERPKDCVEVVEGQFSTTTCANGYVAYENRLGQMVFGSDSNGWTWVIRNGRVLEVNKLGPVR